MNSTLKGAFPAGEKINLISFRGATNAGNGIEPHTKAAIRCALVQGLDIHVDLSVTKDGRCVVISSDDLGGILPRVLSFKYLIKRWPDTISFVRFVRGMVASLPYCERVPKIYFNVGWGVSAEDIITAAADSRLAFAFCSPYRSVLEAARVVAKDEKLEVDLGLWSRDGRGNPLRVAQSIGARYVVFPDRGGEYDHFLRQFLLRARASKVELVLSGVSKIWCVDQLTNIGIKYIIVNNLLMVSGCR